MFTLDAEFRSERCNINQIKNKKKLEIKKELEDSIANGKKNKKTDMEQMAKNCTESEEMQQKLFTNLKKLLTTKKVT